MATYSYDAYGASVYGPTAPTGNYPNSPVVIPVVNTAYLLPGFSAYALDYSNILVEWQPMAPQTAATVTEFRLVSNKWGFPVDQNDGVVLLDTTGVPPTQYTDNTVTPGTVGYYAVYVLSGGLWLRSGFAACLLPRYYGNDVKLYQSLPAFFQQSSDGTVLVDQPVPAPAVPASGAVLANPYSFSVAVALSTQVNVAVNSQPLGTVQFFTLPPGGNCVLYYTSGLDWQWTNLAQNPANTDLPDFLSIIGYGLDMVKTQYDLKFNGLNNPMLMSLGDLKNLAAEIGMPFSAEIPAYTARRAALGWASSLTEKGTLNGVARQITLLSGYPADVQTSRNFMVDDDQSGPVDPVYPAWSANSTYPVGAIVTYPVAQNWSVVTSYVPGNVVIYNDVLYTATSPSPGISPTVSGWSANVNGPYLYYCVSAVRTLPGPAPSGSLSATANWTALYGGNANGTEFTASLPIPGLATTAGTWEVVGGAAQIGVGFPNPTTWQQGAGSPTTGPNGVSKTYRFNNNTGSLVLTPWLRSVSRSQADVTAGRITPDPQLVVEHAVPVPAGVTPWNSTEQYQTNTVVRYQNVNYTALRQSTGATPPSQGVPLNQNWDFETTVSPWVGHTGGSVSQSNAQSYNGTHSMLVTPDGVSSVPGAASEAVPVIPNAVYTASAWVIIPSATQNAQAAINWYDPFGVLMSTTNVTSSVTSATWSNLVVNGTAPQNAASARLILSLTGTPASSVLSYWDIATLTCVSTPEWAPLGKHDHLPVTMSAYAISDLYLTPTTSTTVTPFVEWYDDWGNLISRVFARNTTAGTPGLPSLANYNYDSFNTGPGVPVNGRVLANGGNWTVATGNWTVSTDGKVYAGASNTAALAYIPSPAAGVVAATPTTANSAGNDVGVVFWYTSLTQFWLAGLNGLWWVNGGAFTEIPYNLGSAGVKDRLYTQYNNTTSSTTIPTGTVTGPSVIVYKNSLTSANLLAVVGSGGTAPQTAMPGGASKPGTGATTSNVGFAAYAV